MKEQQKERFDRYLKKYGEFVIAYHPAERSVWKYFNYNSDEYLKRFDGKEYYCNHRYIFPDEIVIDIDCKDEELYDLICDTIIEKINILKVSYELWDTSSKCGYHIHIFFDELNELNHTDRALAKKLFIEEIVPVKYHSYIDFQLSGKHLIRAEYGVYEKNHTGSSYKTLVERKSFYGNSSAFLGVLKAVSDVKAMTKSKSVIKGQNPNSDMPCIQFLSGEDFISLKNGRDRAIFILGIYHINKGMKEEDLYEFMLKYNKYNLNNKFTEVQMKAKMDCWYKYEYTPACKFTKCLLKELDKADICSACSKN